MNRPARGTGIDAQRLPQPGLAAQACLNIATSLEFYARTERLRTQRTFRLEASELRFVALLNQQGTYNDDTTWMWADAAAGYLNRYQTQIRTPTL